MYCPACQAQLTSFVCVWMYAAEQACTLRNMWHDQEEWVGCPWYWFWDIGKNSVPIPCFILFLALINSS